MVSSYCRYFSYQYLLLWLNPHCCGDKVERKRNILQFNMRFMLVFHVSVQCLYTCSLVLSLSSWLNKLVKGSFQDEVRERWQFSPWCPMMDCEREKKSFDIRNLQNWVTYLYIYILDFFPNHSKQPTVTKFTN